MYIFNSHQDIRLNKPTETIMSKSCDNNVLQYNSTIMFSSSRR